MTGRRHFYNLPALVVKMNKNQTNIAQLAVNTYKLRPKYTANMTAIEFKIIKGRKKRLLILHAKSAHLLGTRTRTIRRRRTSDFVLTRCAIVGFEQKKMR